MDVMIYEVVQHDGAWQVRFDGMLYGPRPSQADAVKRAIDAAKEASAGGHRAKVMLHDGTHTPRVLWIAGQDEP